MKEKQHTDNSAELLRQIMAADDKDNSPLSSTMEGLRFQQYKMTREEKNDLFENIIANYRSRKKKRLFRRITAAAACAAAVSAVLIATLPGGPSGDPAATVAGDSPSIMLITGNQSSTIDTDIARIECDTLGNFSVNNGSRTITGARPGKVSQLVVPPGKRAMVTLADGTRVWVNSSSSLSFAPVFEKDERSVYIDGEIFLEVAHDPSKPFLVRCRHFTAEVLGTSFNVRSYGNGETAGSLILVEGSVKVGTTAQDTVIVTPSQMLTVRDDNYSLIEVDTRMLTSWKDGFLTFSAETLGDMTRELSAYYGINIVCDPELAGMKCTGKLVLFDDLESTLEVLCDILPVSVTSQPKQIMLRQRE